MSNSMARRTVYLPEAVETLARSNAREGESFSATVARLIEQGAGRGAEPSPTPSWIGLFEGPGDLSRGDERYLRQIFDEYFEH